MLEISGYEMIEKIASGGMGSVWKARQLSLDRVVAIKILGVSSLPDQDARTHFRREAQTAARLNHPGIVQVYDTGELKDAAYLVMEYVDGDSVGEQIHMHGALKEGRALEIVAHVARALAYAWEKECLIHCDINPNNILVDRVSGVVKVADLGLARMIGMRTTHDENELIVGTPNYTSPEQSAGLADLDCRSDIYSLGATLYHMVTGQLPFHDARGSQAMTRHEEDFLEDPTKVNPELSAPVAWLIEKMMIKNRALRYHFWTQVIKDIDEVRRGNLPAHPLPEEGASTVRRSESRDAKASHPAAVTIKSSREPVKLTIKKTDAEQLKTVPQVQAGQTSYALRNLGFLMFLAILVYTGFLYYGKMKGLPVPFAADEGEAPAPVESEQIDWGDETPESSSEREPGKWENEDFHEGARLFNEALAAYKAYQASRSDPSLLEHVEQNGRDAIAHFEACKSEAPEGVDIDMYIGQCYGLIADVRHSTLLDTAETGHASNDREARSTAPVAAPTEPHRKITFVDDEPEAVSQPEPAPLPANLLRVSLAAGWDAANESSGIGVELSRLLSRYAQPASDAQLDPTLVLYPGVTCMMKAQDAAVALGLELPVRRALETPGFPAASFHHYDFEGDFSGAGQLSLVCDRNDRVIIVQLFDDKTVPARMEAALFSANWTAYDFINGRTRSETDGLIAHRIRVRDQLIRIDTELAERAGDTAGIRNVKARTTLMLPESVAGLILRRTARD